MRAEDSIRCELYRLCKNALEADESSLSKLAHHAQTYLESGETSVEEFGEPHSIGNSVLFSEPNFELMDVIPEFRVSSEDRVDLLITAEESKYFRPFLLFECKRRPFQRPGPSYAGAIRRQAIRYARALKLQHFAIFDGWIILLGRVSFPFLLGIFDAEIGNTLRPVLLRDLFHAVRKLEQNDSKPVASLMQSNKPRDPQFISRQVLPSIARELVIHEKNQPYSGDTDSDKVAQLVKRWRQDFSL